MATLRGNQSVSPTLSDIPYLQERNKDDSTKLIHCKALLVDYFFPVLTRIIPSMDRMKKCPSNTIYLPFEWFFQNKPRFKKRKESLYHYSKVY